MCFDRNCTLSVDNRMSDWGNFCRRTKIDSPAFSILLIHVFQNWRGRQMWQGWNIEVTKAPNYPSWEEVPPCPWLVASPTTHPGPHPHPTSSPSVPESLTLKSLIRDRQLIPIHCSPSWPLTPYSQNTLFLKHLAHAAAYVYMLMYTYLFIVSLSQPTLGEWEDAFIRSPHSSDHQSLWLLHHSHYIWWYHTGQNYWKWKWERESEKLKLYLNEDAVLSSCQVRKGLKQGMDLTQTMRTTTSLVTQPTCCWISFQR